MVDKRTIETGRGSKIVFTESGYDLQWTGFSHSGRERAALPATHTRSPGGAMESVPDDFYDPGTLTVQCRYDVENPPPFNNREIIHLVYIKPDSASVLVVGGQGFIVSESHEWGGAGEQVDGEFTIQKSGEWTEIPAELASIEA